MPMTVYCGIDWAEEHHDIAIVDDGGVLIARLRIGDDAAGYRQLIDLLADSVTTRNSRSPWQSRLLGAWWCVACGRPVDGYTRSTLLRSLVTETEVGWTMHHANRPVAIPGGPLPGRLTSSKHRRPDDAELSRLWACRRRSRRLVGVPGANRAVDADPHGRAQAGHRPIVEPARLQFGAVFEPHHG